MQHNAYLENYDKFRGEMTTKESSSASVKKVPVKSSSSSAKRYITPKSIEFRKN